MYEFLILLPAHGNLPPEEVRREFMAASEYEARKRAEQWAPPGATVGECLGYRSFY